MDVKTVACDLCGLQKQETNHWLVEVTRAGFEGIIFQPAEATESPRNPDFIYKDLCGQECAHKRLAQWLDELNSLFNAPESVTA
jgi:hypothetical protein